MVFYVKQGKVPESRHTYDDRNGLRREELFGEESFDGPYSLLYHLQEPTRVRSFSVEDKVREEIDDEPYSHRHLRTSSLPRYGDIVDGKQTILKNDRVKVQIFKPERKSMHFYRNALCDMLLFVHEGNGKVISVMGNLEFNQGDYIYMPKGLTFTMDYSEGSYFLIFQSRDDITLPRRYLNTYGQIKEGSPYYSRDFIIPTLPPPREEKGNFRVYVEFENKYVIEERDYSPLDVEGWDGYLYPFCINVEKMAPIVGKIHMPPPVHETFSSSSMMVGTFLPRKFDFHPKSIPISYYHNNIDVDEFLFYSSGNFMSRKGIESGSATLHVRGIIHGPQPGAIEGAIGKESTDEIAIMIETYDHLYLTDLGKKIEDPEYATSWYQ
ncbi:MAG: homogentisate 1,2-dioxygenase [Cuniculiplasma sp.]